MNAATANTPYEAHAGLRANVLLMVLLDPEMAEKAARLATAIWEEYPALFQDFADNLCDYGLGVAAEAFAVHQTRPIVGACASRAWNIARFECNY